MSELPICRWRGPAIGQDLYACGSPKLSVLGGVTAADCAGCYLRDHLPGQEAPPESCDCPQVGFRDCAGCGGRKTQLKVFRCQKLGRECTWAECRKG